MGADLIVAGGPLTRAPFRRIEHPEKYQEVAEKVWSEGDDAIYRIPRRSRSLAHVVWRSDVLNLAEDRVEQFVAALEDRSMPLASFTWKNPHLAWIEAEMEPQQGFSVQVNFHSGWRASVDGRELAIERDGLGFMAIYPGCKGPCKTVLEYAGDGEYWWTRVAASLVLLLLVGRCVWIISARQAAPSLSPMMD